MTERGYILSVKIGAARIDERGKLLGGTVGDQTGKEITVQSWYSHPWNCYLECTDLAMADRAASYMEQICNDNDFGYDQSKRLTGLQAIQANGNKVLGAKGSFDCSALVSACYILAGLNISPACNTMTLRNALLNTGKFIAHVNSQYLVSDTYAKRGGIYLKEGGHVVMALENMGSSTVVNTTTVNNIAIDVSGYNPVQNYVSLKQEGIKYAIVKVKRKDGNEDKLFKTHINGFKGANIPVIAYYSYSYAKTVSEAVSDAKQVLQILSKNGITLGTICMDVEDKSLLGLGKTLIDTINAYQQIVEANGFNFVVYTGISFYNSQLKPYLSSLNAKYFWIARYYNGYNTMSVGSTIDHTKTPQIDSKFKLMGWQFTSSGKVQSCPQNVDLSLFYSIVSNQAQKPTPTPTPTSQPVISNITINNYVKTKGSKLNIRSAPNGKINGQLNNGAKVSIYGYSNGYYCIGTNKYISAQYIVTTIGTITAKSGLRVHSNAGAQYSVLKVLPLGAKVNLLSVSGDWVLIHSNTVDGWCSKEYIK